LAAEAHPADGQFLHDDDNDNDDNNNSVGICVTLYNQCIMTVTMVLQKSPQKMKARVDAVFFRQLHHLLSVVVPGVFSSEVGFLCLVAVALVARSLCDLWLIHTSTYIEK
jgi:hypothetical protein